VSRCFQFQERSHFSSARTIKRFPLTAAELSKKFRKPHRRTRGEPKQQRKRAEVKDTGGGHQLLFDQAGPQHIDSNGRMIWIADAHRDNGKRFIVRADEKPSVFLELGSDDSGR